MENEAKEPNIGGSDFAPTFWALAPEYAPAVLESYRLAQTPPPSLANAANLKSGRDLSGRAYGNAISDLVDGVAVIRIDGALDRQTRLSFFTDEIYSLGQDAILAAIEMALANPQAGAILLSINSPGGVAAGTKELADFIAEAATKKPMAAYANGLAASAAFWLAAATGRIFAPRTAQVGSVGVIMQLANYSGFYQRIGIRPEYIASGKFKTAGRGERELTEEERQYFQNRISGLHEIFRADVRNHLKIGQPDSAWAEAQMFLADDALALGLIEEIVRDEQAAIWKLKEETMNQKITLELLEAEAPELLAQIRAEAAKPQAADNELVLAVLKSVCLDEQYEAAANLFRTALALKLSGQDAESLFAAFRAMPQAGGPALYPYPGALNADLPTAPEKSSLVTDAERRRKEKN